MLAEHAERYCVALRCMINAAKHNVPKRKAAVVHFTRPAITRTATARRGLNLWQLPLFDGSHRAITEFKPTVCLCLSGVLLLLLSSLWQPFFLIFFLPLSIAVIPSDTRWKEWIDQPSG